MKSNKNSDADLVHQDLRRLRDELRQMAREASAEDLREIKSTLRPDGPGRTLVGQPALHPQGIGPDRFFIRSVIGACTLVALAWGLSQDWRPGPLGDVAAAAQSGAPTDTPAITTVSYKPVTYTVETPVYDTVMRDEHYTVQKPVTDIILEDQTYTVQKPVTKQVMVKKPYTVRRRVRGMTYEDRTVTVQRPQTQSVLRTERVPVQRLRDSWVFNGWYWQNTPHYVTCYEDRTVRRLETRLVEKEIVRKVPVETIRYVKERRYREVAEERTEYVEEQATRKVPVQRLRYETEERTRQVPERVLRYEREQRVRMVPVEEETPQDCPAPTL